LGRKRLSNPTIQTTIHISIPAFEFIKGYSKLHEPLYLTVDRIISDYEERSDRNTELEIFNQDLKDSLEINRMKRQQLEELILQKEQRSSVIV
jgi:hypothetical protein